MSIKLDITPGFRCHFLRRHYCLNSLDIQVTAAARFESDEYSLGRAGRFVTGQVNAWLTWLCFFPDGSPGFGPRMRVWRRFVTGILS